MRVCANIQKELDLNPKHTEALVDHCLGIRERAANPTQPSPTRGVRVEADPQFFGGACVCSAGCWPMRAKWRRESRSSRSPGSRPPTAAGPLLPGGRLHPGGQKRRSRPRARRVRAAEKVVRRNGGQMTTLLVGQALGLRAALSPAQLLLALPSSYLPCAHRNPPPIPMRSSNTPSPCISPAIWMAPSAPIANTSPLEPDSLQARSNLGAALARAGRYDEAIAEYDRALSKSPDNPALLLNLGLAYYKTGRPAEAAARFERAASLAPQFKEQVTLLLASCYNSLGKIQGGGRPAGPDRERQVRRSGIRLSLWNRSHRRWPERQRRSRHQSHSQPGRFRRSLSAARHPRTDGRTIATARCADLEKAIALNPRLPGAHARLGELLLAMREIRTRARRLPHRSSPSIPTNSRPT